MYRSPSTSEPQTASHEEEYSEILRNESHAAHCVACQGVGYHPVPVALVGECSIPVVKNVAAPPAGRPP
jgi:hypothetical protein